MSEQTLVAVYDTAAHADAAVQALKAANVPANAISTHAASAGTGTTAAPTQERGFWSSLFGGDTDDADTYGRSIASGSTVVTVKVPEQHVTRVSDILEAHDPIDFDERAAGYGTAQTTTTTTAAAPMAAAPVAAATTARATAPATAPATGTTNDDTIKVVEERLTVGKRVVNKGGARVRTYVVETPVEQQVTLHDETVRVERRPVTESRPVTDADFRERTIEVQTRSEEAVVGKEARVVEEIALRKESTEHVETVRDTVRRTEVDIQDGTNTPRTGATGVTGVTGTTGSNPPGTAASRGVDKTLGTNVSGANPGGSAPDGTPGNPPGTMASRAVDKTLGTNTSGANPDRKL